MLQLCIPIALMIFFDIMNFSVGGHNVQGQMTEKDELERRLDNLVSPLRILLQAEEPSRVCKVIIKEIESFNRKRLLTGHVDSLAAYVDLPSADIWRCFNSLMQLHNYVHNYELAASNLKNILSRDSFSDEFITAVINFVNIEQSYKPIIMNAVSKYPSFRSLHCRLQITIGRMVLLRAPDVTLQFWLRVGKGDGNGKWTNDNVVATSACVEDEKIFLMDYGMLSRLIEEVEKIISVACKLERLHLK
ncbi:Nitric oxide synthase, brain [Dirofilaria immitis]